MEARRNKKKKEGQKGRRNLRGKEKKKGLLLPLKLVRLVLLVFLSVKREGMVGGIGFTFLPS